MVKWSLWEPLLAGRQRGDPAVIYLLRTWAPRSRPAGWIEWGTTSLQLKELNKEAISLGGSNACGIKT